MLQFQHFCNFIFKNHQFIKISWISSTHGCTCDMAEGSTHSDVHYFKPHLIEKFMFEILKYIN